MVITIVRQEILAELVTIRVPMGMKLCSVPLGQCINVVPKLDCAVMGPCWLQQIYFGIKNHSSSTLQPLWLPQVVLPLMDGYLV